MASKPRTPTTTDGKRDLPLESRSAPITTINAESRTIEVTWTTGAPVERIDWFSGERYVEELVVSEKAIRLDRLNAGAPVLDNHDRFSGLKSMLAVVDRAWIEKGEGRAIVRFPKAEDDPDADRVFRKIVDGIIRSLSVGYKRLKIEVDKKKEPTVWRVVDWEPFEISFVAIPADIKAQVRADDAPTYRCEFRAAPGENEARRIRMRMRSLASAR
ncbi:MAG: HK97 family phage prohead protease [Proteobacteria bacterium]|nr:HK97 family phage prohead protease [Pseudomonadota bacterium]